MRDLLHDAGAVPKRAFSISPLERAAPFLSDAPNRLKKIIIIIIYMLFTAL